VFTFLQAEGFFFGNFFEQKLGRGQRGRAYQSEPEWELLLCCRPLQAPFPAGFDTSRWGRIGTVEQSYERRGGLRERAGEVLPCCQSTPPAASAASGRWLIRATGREHICDFLGCYC
jgi:hypothetical protein